MKSKWFENLLIVLGVLLIVAALGLTAYNLWDEDRAGDASEELARVLLTEIGIDAGEDSWETEAGAQGNTDNPAQAGTEETLGTSAQETEYTPDYVLDPEMDMPEIALEGNRYIGVLSLPSLGLELPVMTDWSYPKLRIAPCRFTGSVYTNDLVIAAHNYNRHFGLLKTLQSGDPVRFTDAQGNVFDYAVVGLEVLQPTDVEEMTSGDWDLTLFTCTIGGQTRVTVRCNRISD